MYASDFEYAGTALSDYEMMICTFNRAGQETVSSGADLSFRTVKPAGSDLFRFYGASYGEFYTRTFQICRLFCHGDTPYLEPERISALQRWLCRKDGYHPFRVIQDDLKDVFWNATFSSKQIHSDGRPVGLELTLCTDSPYAYVKSVPVSHSFTPGTAFSLFDLSDETGSIYPVVKITCKGSGKIQLQNSLDRKTVKLTGVSADETITLDGKNKIISSSLSRKDLPDHFNFYFPRIINTIDTRENIFTLSADSVPCDITFIYNPIISTGL